MSQKPKHQFTTTLNYSKSPYVFKNDYTITEYLIIIFHNIYVLNVNLYLIPIPNNRNRPAALYETCPALMRSS